MSGGGCAWGAARGWDPQGEATQDLSCYISSLSNAPGSEVPAPPGWGGSLSPSSPGEEATTGVTLPAAGLSPPHRPPHHDYAKLGTPGWDRTSPSPAVPGDALGVCTLRLLPGDAGGQGGPIQP